MALFPPPDWFTICDVKPIAPSKVGRLTIEFDTKPGGRSCILYVVNESYPIGVDITKLVLKGQNKLTTGRRPVHELSEVMKPCKGVIV